MLGAVLSVGSAIGKYDLLEQVGQGGMATVYRGLDRSLRRQVAIKVLHRHLAEHAEARDRFEREAHAVAKLHHDNILEIYDYSGNTSADCYIVTEYIDGTTLKEFVVAHPLPLPELGALITAQIARALAAAHVVGILHRDVKPENVMIRRDGVIKLMDFGISQMVDLERLTVTGQLLGSPAYMSPEHVEGEPLDFRTDVFATGVVLYQLAVGRLPFEGKNPHEVLKRIADCRYPEPRMVNPMVTTGLARIIATALQRAPVDRYPQIADMALALEAELRDSGITDPSAELRAFFAAPAAHATALRPRIATARFELGRDAARAGATVKALDAFNTVLTLVPDHAEALTAIARLHRRQTTRRAIGFGLGLVAVAGAAVGARLLLAPAGGARASADADAAAIAQLGHDAGPGIVVATLPDAQPAADAAPALVLAPTVDARPGPRPDSRPRPVLDAPPAARQVTLVVSPDTSEVRVADGPWRRLPGGRATLEYQGDAVPVTVRNPPQCEEQTRLLRPSDDGREVAISLAFLPARLTVRCDKPNVRIQIDGRPANSGQARLLPFGDTTQLTRTVVVEFIGGSIEQQAVRLSPADAKEVTCAP